MSERSCKDCALAAWERTPGGRLMRNARGRCMWVVPKIAVPKAATALSRASFIKQPSLGAIWRDEPHTNCPTWE